MKTTEQERECWASVYASDGMVGRLLSDVDEMLDQGRSHWEHTHAMAKRVGELLDDRDYLLRAADKRQTTIGELQAKLDEATRDRDILQAQLAMAMETIEKAVHDVAKTGYTTYTYPSPSSERIEFYPYLWADGGRSRLYRMIGVRKPDGLYLTAVPE